MDPNSTEEAVSTNICKKLCLLSTAKSDCSIYKVHDHLRNINKKAYEPEIIAIGPYHHGKDNLKMMEEHKLRYLQSHKNENVKKYISAIASIEQELRKCYAEPISIEALDRTKFIEMMVLDGCFIIDLVRKCNMVYLREKNDPIFKMDWIMNSLQRDLMLFENQIPFIVLCRLFDLIEFPNQYNRLIYLVFNFFHSLYPGSGLMSGDNCNGSSNEIKHLLDLIHSKWHPSIGLSDSSRYGKDKRRRWRFIDSAIGLREANVKFARNEKGTVFDIQFENRTMLIPPLTIEDRTESFLRNMIAYEQYFRDTQFSFVTDYVKLLDCLIDSSKDVQVLSRYGIIDNWLGDDQAVALMFNKLTDSVTGPGNDFIYGKICEDVNIHCNKRKNRWMAKFRRNYLNSPWAVLSIIVAVIALLLTVTQTVFSILQVPVRGGGVNHVESTRRGRGRPRLTWDEAVKRDLKVWNIPRELTLDRNAWKSAIHVPEP